MIIGILGCGAIANVIVNSLMSEDLDIHLDYFYDNDVERAENLANIAGGVAVLNFENMIDKVDLVLEAASQTSVEIHAPSVLEKGKDMIIMSVGALMDEELRNNLIKIAKENDAKIHLPSGAVVGVDGIKAVANGRLDEVSLVTRKSPISLGKDIDKEEILFEGKASEAVKKFPLNINVAATISLACKQDINVKIIVDPKVNRNVHEITVKGDFGEFNTRTMNFPCSTNPKTSMLAAISAIKLLKSMHETLLVGT